VIDTTKDTFLGGQVTVFQPAGGFRSGLDAVMLAAAVPARSGEHVLELGAGCGVASLCLGSRIRDCSVTGVEIDAELVALASKNAKANQADRRIVFLVADALALPASLTRAFDHVFSNPPFHLVGDQRSPDHARSRAKHDSENLGAWLVQGLKRVVPGGTFTMIIRADRLAELLVDAPATGLVLFPLWPRKNEPAGRLILQFRKGSQAPSVLLPGLILHEGDGAYTAEADAVLRGTVALKLS
jgi:tRNA1(Val) A37 N6-methylase TrmN6